jgi:hypothetical protein
MLGGAAQASFLCVSGGVTDQNDQFSNTPYNLCPTFSAGPITGSDSSTDGSSRAAVDYGVLKAFARAAATGSVNTHATASPEAVEDFTLSGGTPGTPGELRFGMSLTGSLTGSESAVVAQLTITSSDCVSSFCTQDQFSQFGQVYNGPINHELVVDYLFTFDNSGDFVFSLTAGIEAQANGPFGGTADFYDTAIINALSIPDGTTLTSGSGTTYPLIDNGTAVPEPSTALIMIGGLIGFAALCRRLRPPVADTWPI